jgi:hypothetical protein
MTYNLATYNVTYGRSPAYAQGIADIKLLKLLTIWILFPLNCPLLAAGGSIKRYPDTGWFHRFLLRHKALRQWLRWHKFVVD